MTPENFSGNSPVRLEADGKNCVFFLIFKNTFNDRKKKRSLIRNILRKTGSKVVAD